MTVTVLEKPACNMCTATKRSLDGASLEYGKDDIYAPDNLELVQSLGYMAAPVVLVRDEAGELVDHWAGFRPDKIVALASALKAA